MRNSPASITTYVESNQLVEKLCEILHFVVVFITAPTVVLPKTVISLFTYYTTDIKDDAFDLPFPMW